MLFDNPDNLYGFMAMANDNEGFEGRSPLEVIACGDIGTLREKWFRERGMPCDPRQKRALKPKVAQVK